MCWPRAFARLFPELLDAPVRLDCVVLHPSLRHPVEGAPSKDAVNH